MSGFLRPEIRRFLVRWAEPLVAGAVGLFGAALILRAWLHPNLWFQIFGWALALGGAGAALAGWRRARFHQPEAGPGLVEVTERRITYYTRLGGGSIDIEEMTCLESRLSRDSGRLWVLTQPGRPPVFIPVNATGADSLFDAFAALPGIDMAAVLATLRPDAPEHVVIWHRPGSLPALS